MKNFEKTIKDLDTLPHNYTLDIRAIERLINLIQGTGKHDNKTPDEIVDYAIYHYGGTIAKALVDMLYNNI